MYTLYDPTIKPVLTTDLDGNIQYIRTYGLHNYNYPDIILNSHFEKHTLIFDTIIHSMFQMKFKVDEVWSIGDQECRLEMIEKDLARVVVISNPENVSVTITTNPYTGLEMWKRTQGLSKLYNHPEVLVSATISQADELLDYIISNVAAGNTFADESYEITYEKDKVFELDTEIDRFGKTYFHIKERVTKEASMTKRVKASYLKRIK